MPSDRWSRWSRRLAAALVLALAIVWFHATLQHGLRNDDYLTVYYTDRETGAVRWDRVFGEFARGWFGVPWLWRPLVSMSFALDRALSSTLAFAHIDNVLFLGVTATAVALTAARLAPSRPWLAAFGAGACVVLHPAAVEPTAWLSARTTGLQVALTSLAALAYVRHAQGHARSWPWLACFSLALCTKEGAVMLPLSLLVLDVLAAPDHAVRERARRLAPGLGLLLVYFGLRWMLGLTSGDDQPHTLGERLHNLFWRTTQLVAPLRPDGARAWWPGALLLLAMPALAKWRRAFWLLPLTAVLLVLPTSHMEASRSVLYGRLIFDALPCLALATGLALTTTGPSMLRVPAIIGAVGWLLSLAGPCRRWIEQYGVDDLVARRAEAAIAAVAPTTPSAPFACTGLPLLPQFHAKLWGALGMRPVTDHDLPVIGLPELMYPDDRAPASFGDAAPVHALFAAGGKVVTWADPTMREMPPPSVPAVELRDSGATGTFAPTLPMLGCGFAALHVKLPAPAAQVRVRLVDDMPDGRAFATQQAAAPDGAVWFDLTHALAPVLSTCLGMPFRGVVVEVDGTPAPAASEVHLLARLPQRELPAPIRGRGLPVAELSSSLRPPPHEGPLLLYVLLPTGARSATVTAADPFPAPLRSHVAYAHDLFGASTVWWFWQTPRDWHGEPWRSELDWATVR